MADSATAQPGNVEVRGSPVHGLGGFATRRMDKGTRIIEYVGERVSHKEADRRYEHKDADDSHTFLFIVDDRTVIDAGVEGNEARFLNHSCNPNCESVIEGGRVFIETLVAVEPGAELTYDYQIQREDDDPENVDEVFACHCGASACRGTMLWPAKRKRGPARKKTAKADKRRAKTDGKRTKAGNRQTRGDGRRAERGSAASAQRRRVTRKKGGKPRGRGRSSPRRTSRRR